MIKRRKAVGIVGTLLVVCASQLAVAGTTWFADMQSNPTLDPGGGAGYWRHRGFGSGGPHDTPWDAGTWSGYQTTAFTGNDSAVDGTAGAGDAGLDFPGGYGIVLDSRPDSSFDNNLTIRWGAQRDADGDAFYGYQPVAKQPNVVEFRPGEYTDNSAGLLHLNVVDDGAGGQAVTVTPVNYGGQHTPDMKYAWVNQNALIDLENKDGDGKTIEFMTTTGLDWNDDPDRKAGLVLATGLSEDVIDIDIDIDVFTLHNAGEVADFRSDNAGLEEADLNYMLANYTIDDNDGVSDAVTGSFGIGVTYWIHNNPAPYGSGLGGGIWDYISMELADDSGTLVPPSAEMLRPFQQPTIIPEPGTLLVWSLLAGLGVGSGWWRRKRVAGKVVGRSCL